MTGERRRRRLRLDSVRARTTVAASAVVAVALVVGAAGFLALVGLALVHDVDEAAEARAEAVAALVREGGLPQTLPGGDEATAVQVVDHDRRVLASTPNLGAARGQPVVDFVSADEEPAFRTRRRLDADDDGEEAFEDDHLVRVLALPATSGAAPVTVYVAMSLETVEETLETVGAILLVAAPLVLAVVAGTTWLLVGRALRPVEAIRREVADLSARALERRVPEPDGDDEIGRLARTMNAMLDRLQAFSDRQRRFVADASHELQSPLASSRAQLEVGLAHPEATDWGATALGLLEENERMEHLVRDLLVLARFDQGVPPPPRHPVDMDDVVLDEVARVRSRGRVSVDMAGVSAGRVRGDQAQLARVARNLLDNAERHARARVSVRLQTVDGRVELTVADDGEGIAPADRERVFTRFTRLDDARGREGGGAGLGLAIAREIVEAHGGTISVEDGDGGARLAVRLPAHR